MEPSDGAENGESQDEEHATERHKIRGIEDEAQGSMDSHWSREEEKIRVEDDSPALR